MKTKATFLVLAVAAALVLPRLTAEEKDKLNGAKCPVAGTKAAKADNSADYRGAKVYFCCENCPKAFAKDTAKYAAKANHQLAQTSQAKQEKCPFTGNELNKDFSTDVAGVKVLFCCSDCKAKVEKAKDDEKVELVFNDKTFDKAFKVEKKK
ncbi:MAG: hypothetical protein IAG10_28490 [Planctomycetaceae bacterium]|nr:hypothetical protein [Planctomycetaceae bacterium]